MGILGWEPASFDLVTELFAPGMREAVLRHGRGNTLRPEAGVFVPNSRAPLDPAAPSASRTAPRTHDEGLSFIEAQLEQNASRPLISNTAAAIPEAIQYPHVYTSTSSTAVTSYGGRLALPMGTIRKEKEVSMLVLDSGKSLRLLAAFRLSARRRSGHPACKPRSAKNLGKAHQHQRTRTHGGGLFPRVPNFEQDPEHRSTRRDEDEREHVDLCADGSGKDRRGRHVYPTCPQPERPSTREATLWP